MGFTVDWRYSKEEFLTPEVLEIVDLSELELQRKLRDIFTELATLVTR